MIAADTWAYTNRLAGAHPAEKCLLGALMLLTALFAGPAPAALVFCCMSGLIIFKAGIPAAAYGKILLAPSAFIGIGAAAAMIDIMPGPPAYLAVRDCGLKLGAGIMLRALGATASLLFICLTTPVTDIVGELGRMKFPGLLLEMTELTYRCIFIAAGAADRITRAQASRLGYASFRAGFRSTGILSGALLIRSLEDSRLMQQAFASRCGCGPVRMRLQNRDISLPTVARVILAVLAIASAGLL